MHFLAGPVSVLKDGQMRRYPWRIDMSWGVAFRG